MKQIIYSKSLLLIFAGLLLFSCGKDEKPDLDQNTTSDNANSQGMFDDAMKVSEDVMQQNGNAKLASPGAGINCATVDSIHYSSNYKRFTITFNPLCQGYDGKYRDGQLVVELNGASYNTPGAVLTIKSVGYKVNGVLLDGKKTVTCVTAGVHNIVVSDTTTGNDYGKITYTDGSVAYWKSKRTRSLIAGSGTAGISDNVYEISATSGIGNPVANGINKEGRSYTVDISSPVRIDFNCFANNTARYPTMGVITLHPDGKKDRTIDYGDGTCDNKVTVSIGKYSKEVNLSY